MAKYILQEMPDVRDTGKTIVYPKLDNQLLVTQDALIDHMVGHGAAFSRGMLEGVLISVADHVKEMLAHGYSVKLDGIGTLSLSLGFADKKGNVMQGDDDKMGYRRVEVKGVNYKSDPEMLKDINNRIELERAFSGVKRIKNNVATKAERMQRTIGYLQENGMITLAAYAELNNVSRASASRDLMEFSKDAQCPIKAQGHSPHRYWTLG